MPEEIARLVIKNLCRWCDGIGSKKSMGRTGIKVCDWCKGTRDHDYFYRGVITYKRVVVGRIED